MDSYGPKLILIIIIPAAIVAGMIYYFQPNDVMTKESVSPEKKFDSPGSLPVIHQAMDEEMVAMAIKKAKNSSSVNNYFGAIIPHHDIAATMIADTLNRFNNREQVKNIIILAPNHSDIANFPAITDDVIWKTQFGDIANSNDILNELIRQDIIRKDNDNFCYEHSISAITPFLKHYFPDAKLAPILFTSRFDLESMDRLSDTLNKFIDENTIIISSIDFSHYLSAEEAWEKDSLTKERILNFSYSQLLQHDSDYLDSPAALITLLKIYQQKENGEIIFVGHDNSANITGHNLNNTTSYFTIIFKD